MGFNFDITAASAILKQRYTEKAVETLMFDSAFLGVMPKNKKGGGSSYIGPIRSATTSSISAVAATAFSVGNPSVYNQWQCLYSNGYGSANVSGAAIDQTNGDANAFVEALASEQDGLYISFGQDIGAALFSNGGGSIGQISSTSNVATATITLANISQIVNFWQNQILQTQTTDGSTGGNPKAGTVTVAAVDIIAGTITATGNWSAGIGTVAASDFIFLDGNYGAKIIGLPGWIVPFANRGGLGTAFNNVTRSADPVRLAGCYFVGGGAPKSESLIQLAMLINRMRGRPDYVVLNPLDYADVAKELSSSIEYITVEAFKDPQIGFPGFKVATPFGMITMLMDVFCPQGTAYMIQLSTWLLVSMGDVPKPINADGLDWLRSPTDDFFQLRGTYRATTYCSAPGKNGVVTF